MRLRLHILAVASIATLGLSACAAFEPAAAVVGSEKIEDASFTRTLDFVLADPRAAEQLASGVTPEQQRRQTIRQLLTFLIQQEVVDDRAAREGIEATEEEVDSLLEQQVEQLGGEEAFREVLEGSGATLADARDLLKAQIVREQVVRAVVEEELGEEELRATYEDRIREFTTITAAHILVESEAQARRIADQVTTEDFADLAERFSQDPGSAQEGGDLGSHPLTDFVEPFANAALEIPVGEIGGPAESEFGFHVIWVKEREQVPFEDVRDQLLGERASQVFGDWLLDRLRSTTIRVNPRYGIFDPETGQVIERTATTPLPGPQLTP